MTADARIQIDIDALKVRFPDTRLLYGEVCALLFFRYGITPTASRLYQYVRKGSMGVPAEALAKFWDDLRGRARVELDHPGLPDPLRQAAGQAMAALWEQASQAARDELAALRLDAQAQALQALQQLEQVRQKEQALRARLDAAQQALQDSDARAQALEDALAAQRREHAAALARLQALQEQVAQAHLELDGSRRHFSAELEKGREAVRQAALRAQEAEHRALRDVDRERTARAQLSKQLDDARASLAQAQQAHQAQLLQSSTQQAHLSAQLQAAGAALAQAQHASVELRAQLHEASQGAARHQAEAAALRALLQQQGRPAQRSLRKNRRAASPADGPR